MSITPHFLNNNYQKMIAGVGVGLLGAYALSSICYGTRTKQRDEPDIVRGDPFQGCLSQIHDNMHKFLSICKQKHGDVFTLRMGHGEYTTFIMDNTMMKRILYNKKADFGTVSKRAKLRFGLVEIVEMKDGIDLLSEALHYGIAHQDNLHKLIDSLQTVSKNTIKQLLNSKDSTSEWQYPTDTLDEWIRHLTIKIELNVLFGPLFANDKELIDLYFEFEQYVPLRLNGAQQIVMNEAMDKLIAKIQTICDEYNCKDNTYNVPHCIQMVTGFCKLHNLSMKTTRNRLIVALLWGTLSNSIHSMTWMVYHILKEPQCYKRIVDELQVQSLQFDIHNEVNRDIKMNELRQSLPSLSGLINEIFRYYGQSNVYRYLLDDVKVTSHDKRKTYKLRKGDWVAGCASFLHRNETYFEDNPQQFKFKRFVDDEIDKKKRRISRFNQKKAKHLMTFGSRCVGRHFAEKFIVILCGLLFLNFEFKIIDKNGKELKDFNVPRIGCIGAYSIPGIKHDDDLSFKWRAKQSNDLAIYQLLVYGNKQLMLRENQSITNINK